MSKISHYEHTCEGEVDSVRRGNRRANRIKKRKERKRMMSIGNDIEFDN